MGLQAIEDFIILLLPVPHVAVRFTRGALVAHWYTYALLYPAVPQYRKTFIPLSASLWNDLADPAFDGVRLADFKSSSNNFLLAEVAPPDLSYTVVTVSSSLRCLYGLVLWGWGLQTDGM